LKVVVKEGSQDLLKAGESHLWGITKVRGGKGIESNKRKAGGRLLGVGGVTLNETVGKLFSPKRVRRLK